MPRKLGVSKISTDMRKKIAEKERFYKDKLATVDKNELYYAKSMLDRMSKAKTPHDLREVGEELQVHIGQTMLGHGRGIVISPMNHGETSGLVTSGVWKHKDLLILLKKRLIERRKEIEDLKHIT